MSKSQCKKAVQNYFETQRKYKTMCDKFDKLKKDFYADMETYFKGNQIDEDLVVDLDSPDEVKLNVKRIQNVSIKFDADKLEKVLPKDVKDDVIVKQYKINDMAGLINYLKSCGVESNVFKSFISVEKSVNKQELERLEELGKIDLEDIKGCYTVKKNEPYFKVVSGKEKGGKD